MEDHYVYELTYPDGTPFYYGKGQGDRIDIHERDARHHTNDAPRSNARKIAVIRSIWASGQKIGKRKIAHFDNEADAYIYEWGMINMTCIADRLTNWRPEWTPHPVREKKPPTRYHAITLDQESTELLEPLREAIFKSMSLSLSNTRIAVMALRDLARKEGIIA